MADYPADPDGNEPVRAAFLNSFRFDWKNVPDPDPAEEGDPSELARIKSLPYVFHGLAAGRVSRDGGPETDVFAVILEHVEDEGRKRKILFSRAGLETFLRLGRAILEDPRVGP